MLEDHCHQLGLDPANITQLMILPCYAPITLTSRQTLFRACDELYQVRIIHGPIAHCDVMLLIAHKIH